MRSLSDGTRNNRFNDVTPRLMGVNELVLKEIEINLVNRIVIIHSSCRKVMFSQVCVKNSVQRGTWMAGGGHI